MPDTTIHSEKLDNQDDMISEVRESVSKLCGDYPGEYWRKLDREQSYPTEFVKALTDAGFLGALIPEEYGGVGLGMVAASVILEEIHHQGCNAAACHAQMYTMGTVLRHGSDEQKKEYLPKIADGSLRLQAFGVTEPTSGTDTTSLRTVAVRDGDDYVINGQKIWTSRAEQSDLMLLLARTTPLNQVNKKTEGLSVFLLDMRKAKGNGLTIRPIRTMMNHSTTEVFFDNLRIPASSLVGEENNGWTYAKLLLMNERIGIAGTDIIRSGMDSIKIMHDHLSETAGASYDGQAISRRYAELGVRLEALEMLEARALTAAEGSGESMVLPLPLKLLGTDLQQDMADLSVDILGDSALPRVGYGFGEGESGNQPNIREQGPAAMRSMLSGRASTIYGGTSEVQRGIMSKFVLGL